jgi:hypothetical protein
LPPGYKQDLPGGTSLTIDFHRGGDRGNARYVLQGGVYTFTPSDQGWELYQTATAIPGQGSQPGAGQGPAQPFQNPPVPQQ